MSRINFEVYVDYLRQFCGVKNARELACEIFAENYPTQQITFIPRKMIEVEDCNYDSAQECWIPSGRTEKMPNYFSRR